MHFYPHMTEEYVLYELPMIRGWAYHAWSMENDPFLQFCGVKRGSRGYVRMQIDKLMVQVK